MKSRRVSSSGKITVFLFLLLISGLNSALALAAKEGAYATRIPEHMCHKLIGLHKCDVDKCNKKCSKQSNGGEGACKGNICLCTFYCKQPPI